MNILSLFANIGVAEALLDKDKFNVVVANEMEEKRSKVYKHIYPEVDMIIGDVQDKEVKEKIIQTSIRKNVDIILATPPCQGMSTAGKMDEKDDRNLLIFDAIDIIRKVNPKYILIENVARMLKTKINIQSETITIKDAINKFLGENYHLECNVVNMNDFDVPQSRERAILLLTRKDLKNIWFLPEKSKTKKTIYDAIGHLPILDPYIYDVDEKEMLNIFPEFYDREKKALAISKWHIPPRHVKRQVDVMLRTPTGKSAFENSEKFLPRKKDGKVVKGYKNTYMRQDWNKSAYTITMYNRTISSQNNVHPGIKVGVDSDGYVLYSDPRVLTIHEIMLCMGLPEKWNLPEDESDSFLRSVIGEGLPPMFVKKTFEQLKVLNGGKII